MQIDTARIYANGTSEKVLSKLDLEKRGIKVDTKYFATAVRVAVSSVEITY